MHLQMSMAEGHQRGLHHLPSSMCIVLQNEYASKTPRYPDLWIAFRGDEDDRVLPEAILPLLQQLAGCEDVRPVLHRRFNMPHWMLSHGITTVAKRADAKPPKSPTSTGQQLTLHTVYVHQIECGTAIPSAHWVVCLLWVGHVLSYKLYQTLDMCSVSSCRGRSRMSLTFIYQWPNIFQFLRQLALEFVCA